MTVCFVGCSKRFAVFEHRVAAEVLQPEMNVP